LPSARAGTTQATAVREAVRVLRGVGVTVRTRTGDSVVMAMAGNGIAHIVALRAGVQMLRADTASIVAVMQHKEPGRDRTVRQLVGHAVCALRRLAILYAEGAVAILVEGARPRPTAIALVDVAPKAFIERAACRWLATSRACVRAVPAACSFDRVSAVVCAQPHAHYRTTSESAG
jgi:hypothetical protein